MSTLYKDIKDTLPTIQGLGNLLAVEIHRKTKKKGVGPPSGRKQGGIYACLDFHVQFLIVLNGKR